MHFLTSESWSNSLRRLSSRPHLESLAGYLQALFDYAGDQLAFIVLFGSMARGDWSRNSDYDLLIGLRGDQRDRFIDRLVPYGRMSVDGRVEALPYYLSEVERMFRSFNMVILAALRDGIVIYDTDAAWTSYQARYRELVEQEQLISEGRGWSWTEEAEQMAAAGTPSA